MFFLWRLLRRNGNPRLLWALALLLLALGVILIVVGVISKDPVLAIRGVIELVIVGAIIVRIAMWRRQRGEPERIH